MENKFTELSTSELILLDGGKLTWSGVCKVAITGAVAGAAAALLAPTAPVIIGAAVVGYVASEILIED